jgi:photosystem II stability/assembly factor-like uncharacterized protein
MDSEGKPVMMKISKAAMTLVLATAAFFLLQGCGDNSCGPSMQSLIGWVVGESDGGYGSILHTLDGGTTWTRQGDVASVPDVVMEAVRAVDSLRAWVVGGTADGYGTILWTGDGGENWNRVPQSAGIPNEGMLDVDVLDATTIWVAGSGNTILVTNDGGSIWTSRSDPAYDGYDMVSVTAVTSTDIWVAGATATDGLILHSTDGGMTWTAEGDSVLLIDYPLISISAWDADHAWTVGHGYTFANTTDGGQTWNLCVPDSLNRTPFSDDANGVCPTGQLRAWVAVDYGGIWFTEDGGQSWTKQTVPPAAGGYFLLRTCAVDHNTAWTVGPGAGDGIILNTTDGTTWTEQTGPISAMWSDVSFVGSYH